MALFEDITKGPVPILLGLGVAMAAPNVIPALAAGLRPLAKALVKGGLSLYDAASQRREPKWPKIPAIRTTSRKRNM